jgi:hypothetical protein
MNTPNDGGPAFPHKPKKWNPDFGWEDTLEGSNGSGMTIRDYAVIHFMAALIQKKSFCIERGMLQVGDEDEPLHIMAEELADAMLAEPRF